MKRWLLWVALVLAMAMVLAPALAAPKKAKSSSKKPVAKKAVTKVVKKTVTTTKTKTTTTVQTKVVPAPRAPIAVLAPVFLNCQDTTAAVAAMQMTEVAARNFGLELGEVRDIDQVLRDFRQSDAPADLLPIQTFGKAPPSYLLTAPVVNPFWPYADFSPSRSGHLLWLGRQLGAKYVYGVEYYIHPKTTRGWKGQTLNGRCQIWLTIVEVDPVKPKVTHVWWPPKEDYEFGVEAAGSENRQSLGGILTGLGALAAFGAIGKGRTTRVLGWAAMATPQLSGPVGEETQVQIQAVDKAIRAVFTPALPLVRK